jgi:DNA-binding transcriptional LysR family regulator
MQEGPEFRHLIAFVAVAEECNFGKAAQRLHITQPALSSQIKQLEDWLGTSLFRRVPYGAELTETGRNFLLFARRILHMRQHALKAASRKHSEGDWPLRLGYSPFVDHRLVQEAIVGYQELVPDGQIDSLSDCTAKLLEMMSDGRLDASIVTLPIPSGRLFEHHICEDRVALCMRRDDPFASAVEVPKEAIAKHLRILFSRDFSSRSLRSGSAQVC